MKLSDNAIAVFKKLYYNPKENSPEQVFRRVAKFVASAEETEEARKMFEDVFFKIMNSDIMRPNSPVMMNAGNIKKPVTSACFVGDMEDDLLSILDFDREAAIIYSHGSGIGINYGILRETNAPLSTSGRSSGPFAFMRKLAATAEAVKSGGRARRAAHLAMMFDDHPDVLEFIKIKGEPDNGLESMNLSVAASDKFMRSIKFDQYWQLNGVVDKKMKTAIKARDMFHMIAENAHKRGDPGIWFIDRANVDNTLPGMGRITSTNPCGEQSLLPRACCCLASINVAKFVKDGEFNWSALDEAVVTTTRFLDNLINVSGFPTDEYAKMARRIRPIGIGMMGLADALVLLGLPYDSRSATIFSAELARQMTRSAIMESAQLAREKGAFEHYRENEHDVLSVAQKFVVEDDIVWGVIEEYGLRNSSWATVAPTGSISISADCSQGMEPFFAICYDKHLSYRFG